MSPQIACLRSGKVTLVALILLLPTVCFQMSHQMAPLRRCILTLVTLVFSFSTVYFQMFPQIPYPKGCIITLAAFIWLAATFLLDFHIGVIKTPIISPRVFFHHNPVSWIVLRSMVGIELKPILNCIFVLDLKNLK